MSKDIFNKLKSIFTNRNITYKTNVKTLKAYVVSVLLYGCECWTLNKDTERKLEAAEMWYLRRMMKISWTERKSNEDIKETVQYKKIFSQDYKKKTIRISRTYICRKNGIEKQMLCGKIESRRSRGRQRTTYIESLNKYTTRNSISIAELIRRTNDREAWRAMVVDVCSRPDT